MAAASRLALYHYPSCPYCQMVRHAAEQLGVELELRDIHRDPAFLRELVDATGRRTVPCLRIEGEDGSVRWMHESTDIIRFLERYASGSRQDRQDPQDRQGSEGGER